MWRPWVGKEGCTGRCAAAGRSVPPRIAPLAVGVAGTGARIK
eukprot:gene3449-61854_t